MEGLVRTEGVLVPVTVFTLPDACRLAQWTSYVNGSGPALIQKSRLA